MLALRQHGHDHFGISQGLGQHAGGFHAGRLGRLQHIMREVESCDGVAGLDEIGGHRASHIAEADECDPRHDVFLP